MARGSRILLPLLFVACAGESAAPASSSSADEPKLALPAGPLVPLADAAGQSYVWTERNTTLGPRIGAVMLDQPNRGRVLMFGGWAGDTGIRNDTWEWDGYGWIRRVPNTDPGGRFGAMHVYDERAKRVLIYGGLGTLGPPPAPADDYTWEWNGIDWAPIETAHSPGVRVGGAGAWDPVGQRALLFGAFVGTDDVETFAGDGSLWAFDGKDWSELPRTEPWPKPRGLAAMIYDAPNKRFLLHGGCDEVQFVNGRLAISERTFYLNDTWEWTPSGGWRDLGATLPVIAVGIPALALDPVSQQILLYVDTLKLGFGIGTSNLYAFENGQWVIRQTKPTDRAFTQSSWSGPNQAMLLTGGLRVDDEGAPSPVPQSGDFLMSPGKFEVIPPPTRFAPRTEPASATLSTGEVVMFGGADNEALMAQTLVWNGGSWRNVNPTPRPSPRRAAAMAALGQGGALLFGGRGAGGLLGDTWLWNGTTWTEHTAGASPPVRETFMMAAVDASSVVLFGGYDAQQQRRDDSWVYREGAGWSKITGALPPARWGACGTQGTDRQSAWLFGGSPADDQPQGALWKFAAGTWQQVANFEGLERRRCGLASAQGRLFLLGGSGSTGLAEVWDLSAQPGVQLPTLVLEDNQERPLRRTGHVTAENPRTGGVLYAAGEAVQSNEQLADSWQLRLFGASCTQDAECGVGAFCTEGVCCESADCGACRTCAGSRPGLCTPTGTFGPAPGCDGEGQACNVQGQCRLNDEQSCGTDLACASGTCLTAGREVGICCQAEGCAVRCVDGNLRNPDGTLTTCEPFGCEGQSCKRTCASIDDCSPGYVCNAERQCVGAAPSEGDEACTCRAVGKANTSARGLCALALLLLLGRRRRAA